LKSQATGPNKTSLMTQISCPLAFEDDGILGGKHNSSFTKMLL